MTAVCHVPQCLYEALLYILLVPAQQNNPAEIHHLYWEWVRSQCGSPGLSAGQEKITAKSKIKDNSMKDKSYCNSDVEASAYGDGDVPPNPSVTVK